VTGPIADAEISQEIMEPRRFVIRGDDSLAFRLADELLGRHAGQVTVIVSSHRSGYGPRIARLAGVEIIEADQVDIDPLLMTDLTAAHALALLQRDDVGNMDAALRAHEINPDLRIVVRMFNTSLGDGLAQLPYCTVLSDVEMAGPAFVAAALGEKTSGIRLGKNRFDVTHRSGVPATDVVCGLAISAGVDEPTLLPADQDAADVVLVKARGLPTDRASRPGTARGYLIRAVLARVWRRVRLILGIFAALLVASAVILANLRGDVTWWESVYVSMLDAFGGAQAELNVSTAEQVIGTVLSFAGIVLVPALTASVVDAVIKSRLELRDGILVRRAANHVVVVGLGGIGSHVVSLLHGRGIDVIGIDTSQAAPGVQVARYLNIPVIIGDATRRETLVAASVPQCRTLLAITSDDSTNLQTALIGRGIAPAVQVVLRLFDGEFADRVQRAFNITQSRSVSYLAAPTFAARMQGQVLDTIAIGRHVLLVAELTVGAYSEAEGERVVDLQRPQQSWIVELTNRDGYRFTATAAAGRQVQRGEVLLVVATRRGLARLITKITPPPDGTRRKPIVVHDTPLYESDRG
jgi:Trk K+ transport system NAD-binding subunit